MQPWKTIGETEYFFFPRCRYREAGEAFDRAFALEGGSGEDYLYAATARAMAGEPEKSLAFLEQATGDDFMNLDEIWDDPAFEILHGIERWEKLMVEKRVLGNE